MAFNDIWWRTCKGMSDAWRARAWTNWQAYFAAHLAETLRRHHGYTVGVEECVEERGLSTSCFVVIDLIERVNGFELPSTVWYSPMLQQMRTLTAQIIGISNDLCSVEKEAKAGTSDNLVLALERERGCSRCDAIESMREMTARRLAAFARLEERVGELDCILAPPQRTDVRRLVDGLHALIRGDNEWERTSGRYATPQ